MANPAVTMMTSAATSQPDIGPHQKSSGAARPRPRMRKQRTRPMLDGLKMCSPRQRITCFERSETAAVPTKIHQPRGVHQSPCAVPGTRSTKATPLPVSIALAGQRMTRWLQNAIATSSSAHVASDRRICAIETSKWKPIWPMTCSEVIVAARCSRGSRSFGRRTGYGVPRITREGAVALNARPILVSCRLGENAPMRLDRARRIVEHLIAAAPAPLSVYVADAHGELVAAATMDGAAPDTRLNAQRKAYTAARSDARSTRELAEKVRDDAVERASFDPFFTFFLGGVAVFEGDARVGSVGVSGLPGAEDERLALAAIDATSA